MTRVLEDILITRVIDFGGHWDQFFLFYEFSYNESYHSSIKMAPYKALYERKCRLTIEWFETENIKPLGTDLVREAQKR